MERGSDVGIGYPPLFDAKVFKKFKLGPDFCLLTVALFLRHPLFGV
jgi:hypothetical protein